MGVLVDEQATISNSVQTASSPAHQERTVNGRWGTGVWGMEWAEYTGNTPRRKDQGWAKWLPNKSPSREGKVMCSGGSGDSATHNRNYPVVYFNPIKFNRLRVF